MKAITSVPSITVHPNGGAELTFGYADGTADTFAVATDRMFEVVARLSEHTFAVVPSADYVQTEFRVSVDTSTPRVRLDVPIGQGKGVSVLLGTSVAHRMGAALMTAAHDSRRPKQEH